MKLRSESLVDGQAVPGSLAFAVPAKVGHVALSDNRNPHLRWEEVPAGTASFAIHCVDPCAPTVGDDVNKEGRVVPADLPRADFHHWALCDLPADTREIAEGAHSQGVQARGKGPTSAPIGRHGLNDYTGWFAGDAEMAGQYFGYDGPCPPWNDELVHRYVWTVYALSVPRLELPEDFTAAQMLEALRPHVLASAQIEGSYTLRVGS